MSDILSRTYSMEKRSLSLTLRALADSTRWAGLYSNGANKWVFPTLLISAVAKPSDCYLREDVGGWMLVIESAFFRLPEKHVNDVADFFNLTPERQEVKC